MERGLDRPGESHVLEAYEAAGGYRAIRKALGIETEWGLVKYAILVRMSEEETA